MDQLVRNRERDQAAASRKEDVAKRPASYKSALSLQLPVGTTRDRKHHRASSPERQHVLIENKAAIIETSKEQSGGFARDEAALEKMK